MTPDDERRRNTAASPVVETRDFSPPPQPQTVGSRMTACMSRAMAAVSGQRTVHKAKQWKRIGHAPKIKMMKEHGRHLRLDDEAERKLIAEAVACNWRQRTRQLFRDIVVLMRDTGMRNERELFRMRIENLDWQNRVIFVPDCGEAVDGVEAVAEAKELYPDLVILDLPMPRMDGLKAASEIHRLMPSIPIIIHTLYRSVLDLTTANEYGVHRVVDKTQPRSLFSTVKELLSQEVPSQSGVPDETSETEP